MQFFGNRSLIFDTLRKTAALGQEIEVSVAELQARLPADVMRQVAEIMRESPGAQTAFESSRLKETLAADVTPEVNTFLARIEEAELSVEELERLRKELDEAVRNNPGIMVQIDRFALVQLCCSGRRHL